MSNRQKFHKGDKVAIRNHGGCDGEVVKGLPLMGSAHKFFLVLVEGLEEVEFDEDRLTIIP